jgi:hypothetical protein
MNTQRLEFDLDNYTRYFIYFVPRKTVACERILEEEGLYGDFSKIGEFALDFLPLERDLLSLELDSMFKDCFVDGDYAMLYDIVLALSKLQTLFGIIPKIKGKGFKSKVTTL